MKKIFLIVGFLIFGLLGYGQTLEIHTDNGGEGFRVLQIPAGGASTDTMYFQKMTYLTDFVRYTTPPEKGIKLTNRFGGVVSNIYEPDSVSVDGTSYGTFFELQSKLDSIFVNFNSGGSGGGYWTDAGTYIVNNNGGDVSLNSGDKLYLDGGGDTYIYESGANTISLYTAGSESVKFGIGTTDFVKNIRPATDLVQELGSSIRRWEKLHTANITDDGSEVFIDSTLNLNSGEKLVLNSDDLSDTYYLADNNSVQLWVQGSLIQDNNVTDNVMYNNVRPATVGYSLGSVGVPFSYLYTANITDDGTDISILPTVGGKLTFGDGDTYITESVDDRFDINTGGLLTARFQFAGSKFTDITPFSTGGADLGTSSLKWSELHTANITDDGTDVTISADLIGSTASLTGWTNADLSGHLYLPLTNDAATPTINFGDDADGIYSSADGNLDFATNGAQRVNIDDNGVTINGDLEVSGDQTYYGEMYVSSSGATSYTSGWEDAPATWSSDELNGATFSDTELTLTNAGKYMVTASVSCSASVINDIWDIGISVNNASPTTAHTIRRKFGNNDVGAMTISGIVTVTASQTIELQVNRNTGSGELTFNFANVSVHKL